MNQELSKLVSKGSRIKVINQLGTAVELSAWKCNLSELVRVIRNDKATLLRESDFWSQDWSRREIRLQRSITTWWYQFPNLSLAIEDNAFNLVEAKLVIECETVWFLLPITISYKNTTKFLSYSLFDLISEWLIATTRQFERQHRPALNKAM